MTAPAPTFLDPAALMSIRNLIDAVPMPVIEVDAKDRIRSANTAAEQLLGAPAIEDHEAEVAREATRS